MEFKINAEELEKLYGLPYLCQILYFRAIRQYMNYATGIVGIHRGISYQSLREQAYVAPHPGYKSEMPSESQVRRAVDRLISIGLLERKSNSKKLILGCLLASTDNSAQIKVGSKPAGLVGSKNQSVLHDFTCKKHYSHQQVDCSKTQEVVTPPVTGIINKTHTQRSELKKQISRDYHPSPTTIENAKLMQYDNVTCPLELAKFIAYHTSKGTQSCDWDSEYFYWVLNGKRNQQGGKKNVRYNKPASAKPISIVDSVALANQHFFEDNDLY